MKMELSEQSPPNNSDENNKLKEDDRARALANMATFEYNLREIQTPAQKHLIPRKWLVYIAVSTVIGLVSLAITSLVLKNNKTAENNIDHQTQQLLDGIKEIQDANKELNSN